MLSSDFSFTYNSLLRFILRHFLIPKYGSQPLQGFEVSNLKKKKKRCLEKGVETSSVIHKLSDLGQTPISAPKCPHLKTVMKVLGLCPPSVESSLREGLFVGYHSALEPGAESGTNSAIQFW